MRQVKGLTNNQNEIYGLSYNLLFKALRLVLIFSLTIVQISIAFTKSVSKQFDKGMLRALDLGYKEGRKSIISNKRDFTSLANKSISCTKLTDAQKHMFNSMLLTSNSQETPQTTLPLQTTPLLQATIATTLYMLMLPLSTLKSLMFESANVTEFLKRYKDLCLDY